MSSPAKSGDERAFVLPGKWHKVEADVQEHERILQGAGDPRTGLVVRVDRVERSVTVIKRLAWTILAAVIATLATTVVDLVVSKVSEPVAPPATSRP